MRNREWEVWKDCVLEEPIKRVIFSPNIWSFSNLTAHEAFNCNEMRPETCGYLEGSLIGSKFYVFANASLGTELRETTSIMYAHPVSNETTKRFAERINGFRTVLFHTHPRVFVENLKDIGIDDLEFLKEEMNNGIYDYLGSVNLDLVVNDVLSRNLSEADIQVTPGNYHLLISPTPRKDNPTSHLNFYQVNKKNTTQTLIPVRLPTPGEMKVIKELEKKMKKEVREWKLETFGFDIGNCTISGKRQEIIWNYFQASDCERERRNDVLKYGHPNETYNEPMKIAL